MTATLIALPVKPHKPRGDSQVVKVVGHEFTAYYEAHGPDDSAGLPNGYIELGSIYIDDCPDDMSDVLAAHVTEAIAEQINTRLRAEAGRL